MGFVPPAEGAENAIDLSRKSLSVQKLKPGKRKRHCPVACSGSDGDSSDENCDHFADKNDVFAEKTEKTSFLEFSLDDDADLFEPLKLTEEQLEQRAGNGKHAECFSVYEYKNTAVLSLSVAISLAPKLSYGNAKYR